MNIEKAIERMKSYKKMHSDEYFDFVIAILERQSRVDEVIKILQTIDWVGSGAKARIQEAIELLT